MNSIGSSWSLANRFVTACFVVTVLSAMVSAQAPSEAQTEQKVMEREADRRKVLTKGIDFLIGKGQAEDGSFSKSISPAVTGLCLTALMQNDVPPTHPAVVKGLGYLEQFVQADGGIYAPGSGLKNYETSISLLCYQLANKDGKYDKRIEKAAGFLKGLQWDDGENHPEESDFYGGQGYGSHKRPDLSNTSYFIEAMKASGEDPDSAAMQKALKFLSRGQNLPSKDNMMEFATKATNDDRGGMIYTPANGGESKAGDSPTGGLRSYASMTYAGLKSFIYAGVAKDDIRVKAAQDWISRHYDLTSNPGMGQQGLFYYYHVFGKTLSVLGDDHVVDSKGAKHDWRRDLISQLGKLQKPDGSWTNPADRWYEGDPNLVTAYAMLGLSYCGSPASKPDGKK